MEPGQARPRGAETPSPTTNPGNARQHRQQRDELLILQAQENRGQTGREAERTEGKNAKSRDIMKGAPFGVV